METNKTDDQSQEELAIYKIGAAIIQTTVKNGYCDFTGHQRASGENYTVDEYLKILGPGFVCISLDDAAEQANKVKESIYIKPWEPITLDQWEYWLEVLPPEKWLTVSGVNLFRLSEYTDGFITQHCARIGDRCFSAYRKITDRYEDLAREVKNAIT